MSNAPQSAVTELTNLINSEGRKERECRKYLHYAHTILFREDVPKDIVYEEPEMIGSAGVSDYVISGSIGNNPSSSNCVKAYVWELKAPQCFLFKKDNENRLRPTPDLNDAENKLLNYVDELRGNHTLQTRFGVTHSDYVCIGGIVIGCKSKLVDGNYEEAKKTKLLNDALRIREEWFYKRAGIRLITWSHVLDHISGNYRDIIKQNTNLCYAFQTPQVPSGTISTLEHVHSES